MRHKFSLPFAPSAIFVFVAFSLAKLALSQPDPSFGHGRLCSALMPGILPTLASPLDLARAPDPENHIVVLFLREKLRCNGLESEIVALNQRLTQAATGVEIERQETAARAAAIESYVRETFARNSYLETQLGLAQEQLRSFEAMRDMLSRGERENVQLRAELASMTEQRNTYCALLNARRDAASMAAGRDDLAGTPDQSVSVYSAAAAAAAANDEVALQTPSGSLEGLDNSGCDGWPLDYDPDFLDAAFEEFLDSMQ